MSLIQQTLQRLVGISLSATACVGISPALALPPPEDPPEEVLRTEIITEARSPVNGELLSAAEYAELQAELADSPNPPTLSPEVERTIRLLRIRRAIRSVFPFLLR